METSYGRLGNYQMSVSCKAKRPGLHMKRCIESRKEADMQIAGCLHV